MQTKILYNSPFLVRDYLGPKMGCLRLSGEKKVYSRGVGCVDDVMPYLNQQVTPLKKTVTARNSTINP